MEHTIVLACLHLDQKLSDPWASAFTFTKRAESKNTQLFYCLGQGSFLRLPLLYCLAWALGTQPIPFSEWQPSYRQMPTVIQYLHVDI